MTIESPLVSVVIPAYNAANHLVSAVASVQSQSERRWEAIIVDDASTDSTLFCAEELARQDSRIRVIRAPSNFGGPAGPRNLGVRAANAPWVAFLDADDLWHPSKLRIQIDVLNRSGERFCSSGMFDFADGVEVVFREVRHPPLRRIGFWTQLIKFRTPTSSVICDRKLLLAHPFNEQASYRAREDMDCWLACIEEARGSIKIAAPLVGYRKSAGQISRDKLRIIGRHFHVLRHYRIRGERPLGLMGAALFTATHCMFALPSRLILGRM